MRLFERLMLAPAMLSLVLAQSGCGPGQKSDDVLEPSELRTQDAQRGPATRPYAVTPDEQKLLEQIRGRLAAGLDINKPIATNAAAGTSPLDMAAARRETFLHVAAREGWVEAAKLLLQNGARHDVRTINQSTPLHLACTGREVYTKSRTLSLARIYGIEVARLLLAAGADVKVTDARERTPLHLACRSGDPALARLLLDKGADKNAVAMDDAGRLVMTPLLETALGGMEMPARATSGHAATAMLLLERRAKVNLPPDGVAVPPLTWAAAQGHRELASELIRRGAPVNAAARGRGRTALMAAAESGDALMVTLLLDAGADVNARDSNGQSALTLANRNGHGGVVQVLLKRGAQQR